MADSVTPMIHVPDVRATKEWYESIGFLVTGTNEVDGEIDWARGILRGRQRHVQ
jgi:hypothetical protein